MDPQLQINLLARNQWSSSPGIAASIGAKDSYLGELDEVVEAMNWKCITVCEFKLQGR